MIFSFSFTDMIDTFVEEIPRRLSIFEEPTKAVIELIRRDPREVVVGSVCDLLEFVSEVCETKPRLKPLLKRMREILTRTDASLTKMSSLDMNWDLPTDKILGFVSDVIEARRLIVILWNGGVVPMELMQELEASILCFYLDDLKQLVVAKLTALRSTKVDNAISNRNQPRKICWSFPGRLGIVVGPQDPFVELKGVIKECGSPVVISAPPGHGKTTLVRQICEDPAVRDEYDDNIFFLHVSETTDVVSLVYKLVEDVNRRHHDRIPIPVDTRGIREVGSLVKSIGVTRMLLVLDDVWREWEYLIDEFNFQIPGYKLLVTSRFRFPRFDRYEQTRLCQGDGRPFYFQSVSGQRPSDPNSRRHHLDQVQQLPVLVWKRAPKTKVYEAPPQPVYVQNVEAMTKSVAVFDRFETEDCDAFVLPHNYLETRIMDDDSGTRNE